MRTYLIAVLVVAGCGPSVAPPYLLEDVTVIAVQADPPEALPDQNFRLRATVFTPDVGDTSEVAIRWWRCGGRSETQNSSRCETDRLNLDSAVEEISARVQVGHASHVVQTTDLAGVPTWVLAAGYREHVQVSADQGPSQSEAVKRVVVTDLEDRNKNPRLQAILVGVPDVPVLVPPYVAGPGAELVLQPVFDQSELQTYAILDGAGQWSVRQEAASFTWQVSGGDLDRWNTVGPYEPVRWTLPETPGKYVVFCTLRDGRGGADVLHAEIEVY